MKILAQGAFMLFAGLAILGMTAPSASADSCYNRKTDLGSYEHCDGLRFEYIGSKVVGEADVENSPYTNTKTFFAFAGTLTDKRPGDGLCASVRLVGSIDGHRDQFDTLGRNCSGTPKKVTGSFTDIGVDVIDVELCQAFSGKQTVCSSFFKRSFDGSPVNGSPPYSSAGYELAFQANTTRLLTIGPSGAADTGQGVLAGTSPSITRLATGGYETAFNANTGALVLVGDGGSINTGQGMMPGTSPSIAASASGGFRVAFQANTGVMYTYDSTTGPASTGQGMQAGTSPAITALPGTRGYQMAFDANNGALVTYGDAQLGQTGQGMMPGTSPSIAASASGGFRVAFQANTGVMYTYDSTTGPASTGQGMQAGTSPAITALPGTRGYQMAFDANNGALVTYGDAQLGQTGQGMMPGTSPSIAASASGGFRVAFQANTGVMYIYDSTTGPASTGQGMQAGTSPAITPAD